MLTPRDWFFLTDPSGPDEPKMLVAVATYPIERGGGCAPTRALDALPPDGALAWLIEYTSPQGNVFPPRPPFFPLDDASLTRYECSGSHATYMFRFADMERFFQVHVAFGERAGERVRSEMMATLSTLEIDRCPPADTPGPVTEFGSLVPEHGAPGDVVILTGPTGRSENWFWVRLGSIEVWWSSAQLVGTIRTGDQRLLATIDPGTTCSFTATFEVPDVSPGEYLITVLHYEGGGYGLAAERTFTVTQ